MERLFLIDGMAIAYRAYFAFIGRPLINSKGLNTGAVYGFVNAVEKILNEEKPDHIAVAWDTKEPTFRHKRYPAYKATREAMPDDMIAQLPYLKELVQAYNIPTIELPGWEADDIIGTLAARAEAEGLECFLVTPDKDYLQLVSERVRVYKPPRGTDDAEIVTIEGVREKFGVAPDQVIDVLGLMGDQSDNIPGVKGIGEKTAIPLVQEFGSIPGIYERIGDVKKESVRKKLAEQKEMAFLSRELATIAVDAPVEANIHELRAAPKNYARLGELFAELEFRTHLQKLRAEEAALRESRAGEEPSPAAVAGALKTIADTPHTYVIVRTEQELQGMIEEISKHAEYSFDTETTGLNPHVADLVGLSFALRPCHAWYIPANLTLPVERILELITPLICDRSKTLIGQNLKYDLLVLRRYGIATEAPLYDTMLASYILSPEGEHTMDALSRRLLGYDPVSITTLIGKGKNQKTMDAVPIPEVAEYAAEDADITLQLAHALRPKVRDLGQEKLLDEIEFPLLAVLVDVESAGVRIDTAILADIAKEMEQLIDGARAEIIRHAGVEFNVASTQQLGDVLFNRLGLPAGKKTKTGWSTDQSVLEGLLGLHPIVDAILLYRQMAKLKSTYVDALPKLINPRTGRVHTSFNQAVAATGRLSSADPNLQNIPIRTEAGREIRKAFVAVDDRHCLLSADYSQIELRLAAEMSADESMIAAFRSGADIHTDTACRLYGVAPAEVTAEMRRRAKTTNFGILYGISAFGLARRLGIPNGEAKELIDLYFHTYPKINRYIADTLAFAKKHGFVQTLMGRRRYIADINNRNRTIRQFAERTAINAPLQGSAADLIKLAMIAIHRDMIRLKMRSRMVLQVHDELVFEADKREVKQLTELVVDRMKHAMPLSIPIEVEVGTGANWLEAH